MSGKPAVWATSSNYDCPYLTVQTIGWTAIISSWMRKRRTPWSWAVSRSRTRVSGTGHLEIGSSLISFQPNAKDLGAALNSGLPMCDHISSVCRSAYLEPHRIGSIRPFLTIEAAAEHARSRILSRIDYCNSLAGWHYLWTDRPTAKKYKTTLPNWPSVRNVMTLSHFSWRNSIGFLFNDALSSNWQLFHSAFLVAHYHLTSPAVCPHSHPPDLFVLPLKNFWPSRGSLCKVLVHGLFNTRLHSFGIHYLWKSASARLCRLLRPS